MTDGSGHARLDHDDFGLMPKPSAARTTSRHFKPTWTK
jgi:hypothetical protein